MKQTMHMNIKAKSYHNAIFFADKIVNLVRSTEPSYLQSPAKSSSNQAAAPAGGRSSEKEDSSASLKQENGKKLS